MSVADLADAVHRVRGFLRHAHEALARAAQETEHARDLWGSQVGGAHDEVREVPAAAERACRVVIDAMSTLAAIDRALCGYLTGIGATAASASALPAVSSSSEPGAAAPESSRRETAKIEDRVRAAQARVGRRADGTATHGEWVRSDGWSVRFKSGPTDEHFHAARSLLAARLPRPVSRLATHVEVKVAVRMREDQLTDETLVIDRGVCGTRPFDVQQRYTCDRYLPSILPPGSRLRVVQPDGTIQVYEGDVDQ